LEPTLAPLLRGVRLGTSIFHTSKIPLTTYEMAHMNVPLCPTVSAPNALATPEFLAHLAILLRAVSHFTTTLLFDIDIRSPVASYEHEARKKILSAFYVAQPSLMHTQTRYPFPPC